MTEKNEKPYMLPDVSIYRRSFPKFGYPNIIGYIGLENLKFARNLCNSEVNFDLNKHVDKAKKKPPDLDVKLNDLLIFLLNNEKRLNFKPAQNLQASVFFCYRGLMTCVACTPYEYRDPWKIVALLHKGNIYLCAREREEETFRKINMTEKEKLFTSWGYKFEQYILSDKPDEEPNSDIPVDETKEFSLVFENNIKSHKVVYGAEMDGIICEGGDVSIPNVHDEPEKNIQYLRSKKFVELKTNRHIQSSKQDKNFRKFKIKKWWCQSFLVGIEQIVCGSRDDNGIVEELQLYKVSDLPKMGRAFWDPSVCFNFLEKFFTFVKTNFAREIDETYGVQALGHIENLPLTSLLFEYIPNYRVVSSKFNHDDDPILHDWFLNNYGKHNYKDLSA